MSSMDTLGLHRQPTTVTMQMSAEQYERLFLQPEKAKANLAQRFGNPTLLGLIGLLIPFQTTMWCLVQFKGADATSLTAVSGPLYFMGGIAMNIAGLAEFILGNAYSFAVFIIYGCYFVALGYTGDPSHALLSAFGEDAALSQQWNAGLANFHLVMAMVSFIFLIGALRTNIPTAILFLTLIILYCFIAAADYRIGFDPTPEGLQAAAALLKIGGGFGFLTAIMGWYLVIIAVCASTDVPCPLPVFDLSKKNFTRNKALVEERAAVSNDTKSV